MVEVVKLRAAKKRLARARNAAQGAANAVKFGRTRAQKKLDEAQIVGARAALDAHRREP